MIQFRLEIARKTIHLSSLWIPILYLYVSKTLMLQLLIPLTLVALIIDLSRRFFPKLNRLINLFVGNMMRSEEKELFFLSGATHLLIAASLTTALFTKEIAIFSLSILMISDSFAALIGRNFGKIRIANKSLEGSLSFAISAIFIYYFFNYFYHFSLPLNLSLLAILAATIVELFAKKIHVNDNFAIPLVIGLVLHSMYL